jgi:cytochrome oxidase Cu insertion factor (SCO1/SenC/PrrC family)
MTAADLMAITQALDALGPAAEGIQPVFITVDPKRDTRVLADCWFDRLA